MNAWRSPPRIGQAHLADQIDDFVRHAGPTLWMAALPSPIQAESSSVPSDDGFRFDDHQGRSPVTPEAREPGPGSMLQDQELMPESKHLSLQGEARAETITYTEE